MVAWVVTEIGEMSEMIVIEVGWLMVEIVVVGKEDGDRLDRMMEVQ